MNQKRKCTLLMSCHSIINPEDNIPFETGVYGEGSLVVVSGKEDVTLVQIPKILDLLWDKEVEMAFVYLAGFSSSTDTLKKENKIVTTLTFIKIALDRVRSENVHLVGCSGDLQKKESFAKAEGLDFIGSGEDCGGSFTLGKIAVDALKKASV
ncbi:MAG: hypothetical protein AAB497_00550 [Patescibacteria group bacterium]